MSVASKVADWRIRKRRKDALAKLGSYIVLGAVSIIFTIPFLTMIMISLKSDAEIFSATMNWLPKHFIWRNYVLAWTAYPFLRFTLNTVIITAMTLFGNLLSCSIVAFGFARLRAPGREILFYCVLASIMIPGQVTLIPVFILFKILGWLNTFKPLIVPSFFGTNAFFIFLLRQFLKTLPQEMEDSARVDGCGSLRLCFSIMLPLAKPALATIAVFSFFAQWNDFMGPLIFLTDMKKYTLALGLKLFYSGFQGEIAQTNWIMAASVLVVLPCLVVFLFCQRYFVKGMVFTGLKG